MLAKQSGHHNLSTVAQIVGPDDLGPQVKNEVVGHCDETTCFDAHAVRFQGIASTQHPWDLVEEGMADHKIN